MHGLNKQTIALTILYLVIVALIIHCILWLLLKYTSALASLISWGTAIGFIAFSLSGIYWNPALLLARSPVRKPMLEEQQRIATCLEKLKQCSHQIRSTSFRILMTNSTKPAAFAVGTRTISLSTGLLDTSTDEELCAVIAHEAGHIICRDTLLSAVFVSAHAATVFINGSIRLVWRTLMPRSAPVLIKCVCLAGYGLFFILKPPAALDITIALFLWYYGLRLLNLFFEKLQLYCCRRSEYRQDAFTSSLGYGKALRAVLLRLRYPASEVPTAWDLFHRYSHPILEHRIHALEKMEGLRD